MIKSASSSEPHWFTTLKSPLGKLKLVARNEGLTAILWQDDAPGRVPLPPLVPDDDHPVLRQAALQVSQYFSGERVSFDLPLAFSGTEFQRRVWRALLEIPFGETRSYGDLARQLGNAKAFRAVGAANGRNPLSIVAPCHRVVGADGTLTGFAGGIEAKAYLLAHERRLLQSSPQQARSAKQ